MSKSRLAFIMGAPRTGTTALTRMLMGHPDVFLADAKALNSVNDDAPTFYESAIFFRDLSDDEIVARFQDIDGFGQVIVEKTPSHIVHLERIRRLFPEAHFLITHREPYSCMCSWKVASRKFLKSDFTFQDACRNWREATEILMKNKHRSDVISVDYADFMAHKEANAELIFDRLGLAQMHLAECLRLMDAPETERLPEVVGESITGGSTTLSLIERYRVAKICGRTEKAYQKGA